MTIKLDTIFEQILALFVTAVIGLGAIIAIASPSNDTKHIVLPAIIEGGNVDKVTEQLLNATSSDRFVIHINGYGGDVAGGYQLLAAIKETKANVRVEVEGFAMSMYAAILSEVKNFNVPAHAVVMFHTMQTGGGPMDPQHPMVKFLIAELAKSGIFTKTEICQMVNGREFWFTGTEFNERADKRQPLKSVVCEPKPDDAKAAAIRILIAP